MFIYKYNIISFINTMFIHKYNNIYKYNIINKFTNSLPSPDYSMADWARQVNSSWAMSIVVLDLFAEL